MDRHVGDVTAGGRRDPGGTGRSPGGLGGHLEVGQAVVEEDVPSVEEELLLADTQQAGDQRVQGLGTQRGNDKERERQRLSLGPYNVFVA